MTTAAASTKISTKIDRSFETFPNFKYLGTVVSDVSSKPEILSRNILKRVDESRHLCQSPTVVWKQPAMLLLKRTAPVALLQSFSMTWIRFVRRMKIYWGYFSHRMRRLKIYSVVLLPALKSACSSAMISACGFNLFSMIFTLTLLGWLMRLIVR